MHYNTIAKCAESYTESFLFFLKIIFKIFNFQDHVLLCCCSRLVYP